MDPVTMAILAAVASGTTGAVLAPPIKDAYERLKALIKQRFGRVATAIEELETTPDSGPRQAVVGDEVKRTGASTDTAIVTAAQEVLKLINAAPGGSQTVQNVIGNFNAIATGGSTASVNVNQSPKPSK